MADFQTERWLRANIRDLKPYSSARTEYSGEAMVFLDANENPFPSGLNRYPDPAQTLLKEEIGRQFLVSPDEIFLGNGSDEAIDLLIRLSCEPGRDRIASITPSYGMYAVCADIQGVPLDPILLNADFSLNADRIMEALGRDHKLLFLCSPNNPTGNTLDLDAVEYLLQRFHGVVVVDEAYVDFSDADSLTPIIRQYPNLVVLRTFSKAWGLAGARCGMAFGHPAIMAAMAKVKYPYNLNVLTQQAVMDALKRRDLYTEQVQIIRSERQRLFQVLGESPVVEQVYPSQANFLLIRVADPTRLYLDLLAEGLVVRDRSRQPLCAGCLRVTIGTPMENDVLIKLFER